MIRAVFIKLVEFLAWLLLLPLLFWSRLPFPEYSTFTAPSQLLALVPGYIGVLLRRVWYQSTLKKCGSNLTVDWMSVIRIRKSEIGDRCTIGVSNWIGWVSLGNDVMTGSQVALISGARQHDFSNTNIPMRMQHGNKSLLEIGEDVWIGTKSVVMADVSKGTVIGAGSVVTKKYESFLVIAGNPARPIRHRMQTLK